jgi:hypothetical protein
MYVCAICVHRVLHFGDRRHFAGAITATVTNSSHQPSRGKPDQQPRFTMDG